jgi:hypothetical protein
VLRMSEQGAGSGRPRKKVKIDKINSEEYN